MSYDVYLHFWTKSNACKGVARSVRQNRCSTAHVTQACSRPYTANKEEDITRPAVLTNERRACYCHVALFTRPSD